jgi:uncharacterized protein (DUF983 family)
MSAHTPPRSYSSTIWHLKCPRCREGDLFKPGSTLLKTANMYDRCEKCGVSFQQEPGFYYGAMYISYGMGVAIFMPLFILTQIVFETPWWVFLGSFFLTIALLIPFIFRYSRAIYISLFVYYHDDAIEAYEKEKASMKI